MFILTRVKREAGECMYTTLLCHHPATVPKHTQIHIHTETECVLTQPLSSQC